MVVGGAFVVRMILLQIAVEGGRFAGVVIFLFGRGGGSCSRCCSMSVAEDDDRLPIPLLLLLLLLGIVWLL